MKALSFRCRSLLFVVVRSYGGGRRLWGRGGWRDVDTKKRDDDGHTRHTTPKKEMGGGESEDGEKVKEGGGDERTGVRRKIRQKREVV